VKSISRVGIFVYHSNKIVCMIIQMEVTREEQELYALMKDLPDFDSYPIPLTWFKAFNIPPRNPVPVKEYLESNYAMKMAVAKKDLPPIIYDTPQQDGKLVKMVEEEPVKVETISRPFETKGTFPTILPSLLDPEIIGSSLPVESRPQADNAPAKVEDDTGRSSSS
jgi:hypothetical protein